MIEKIKVGKRVFVDPRFVGFGTFSEGDGFLLVIEEKGAYYAISPSTGKVYDITLKNNQLYIEIPYGGRVYRAPLRFKL
ncbi:MAG: hypothetical protein LM590_15665 [Thermofilum sp.]|nr:hypothetical protein [Thermofilum sp.]